MSNQDDPDYLWLALERMAEEGTLPKPYKSPGLGKHIKAMIQAEGSKETKKRRAKTP